MSRDTKRLTLDLGPNLDHLLVDLADADSTTKAEIIRRALASYAYFKKQKAAGNQVAITSSEGAVVKEVVLP